MRGAGAKILKFDPDIIPLDLNQQLIERPRTWAFRIGDFAADFKETVVARAKKTFHLRAKIDETTGVRTNNIQSNNRFFVRATQINSAHRSLWKFIPRIRAAGDDGKLSRRSIRGQRIERG